MKIYFDQSGRGVKKLGDHYEEIYQQIEKLGHTNLRPVTDPEYREEFYKGDHKARVDHYIKTIDYIKKADIVVLEVTIHSLSMGYILERSLQLSKPVIALYQKGYKPAFAEGIVDEKFQLIEYSDHDLSEVLSSALSFASDQQDTRFNFFISPKHQNYLDWIAKNRRIPRSVFLRRLIEQHMTDNEDYQG